MENILDNNHASVYPSIYLYLLYIVSRGCRPMKNKTRVLIVDQDENVLIGLERILEEAGYHTVTAWGKDEAFRLAGVPFDVLLIDQHLGSLDSEYLINELKQLQPEAILVLMYNQRREDLTDGAHPTVCKWEHDELKARLLSYSAA